MAKMIFTSKHSYFLTALLAMFMKASIADSTCSRDDVEFYLGKGFTPDQVTELCRSAPAPAGTTQEQKPAAVSEAPVASNTVQFLQTAIKARDVNITGGLLHYTRKEMCFTYGEEDLYGFAPKACPDVKFTITLKGLSVIDTGREFGFYGTKQVRVKGTIEREILGGLEKHKPEDKQVIMDKFEKGNETNIPVRDDFSMDDVREVLEQLAK